MVGSGKRGVHPSDSSGSVLSGGGSYTEIHEEGYCGFTEPFQFSWFFTIVGAEYFHVYLWIAKDFSWTQEFKTLSLFFGTCATLWCIVIFFNAFQVGNNDEVYSTIALFLWIFANYWWMTGDVHDDNYPDEPSIYDQRSNESAIILTTAVCWLTVYYFVIIPFGVMPVSPEAIAAYDDGSFQPRFRLLKTFRQYENLHMYFWLIKDLCWNLNFISMWFVMLVPAVFLAGDFFFIAVFCKVRLYRFFSCWVLVNTSYSFFQLKQLSDCFTDVHCSYTLLDLIHLLPVLHVNIRNRILWLIPCTMPLFSSGCVAMSLGPWGSSSSQNMMSQFASGTGTYVRTWSLLILLAELFLPSIYLV